MRHNNCIIYVSEGEINGKTGRGRRGNKNLRNIKKKFVSFKLCDSKNNSKKIREILRATR